MIVVTKINKDLSILFFVYSYYQYPNLMIYILLSDYGFPFPLLENVEHSERLIYIYTPIRDK